MRRIMYVMHAAVASMVASDMVGRSASDTVDEMSFQIIVRVLERSVDSFVVDA